MNPFDWGNWTADWIWSLPLVVLNTVMHVIGLGLITERVVQTHRTVARHRRFTFMFFVATGLIVLLVTALHGTEALIWAGAFRLLGALPDFKTAMLYSLGAMTTYGHANLLLKPHWQLMGTIEALNGVLLFGLTTAFLFAMVQKLWPLANTE
jgi:MFS superfamily sulfate permease-like transporter